MRLALVLSFSDDCQPLKSVRISPWVVVWLCFATLSIVMSARQSVSIMTDEWANTLGWSKTFIGSGQSVAFVVMAIFSPIAGNLADRFGARALLTAGLLIVAFGFIGFATFPMAGVYIMATASWAALALPPPTCIWFQPHLAKLFKENRGLATGIANSGATAGQFITVPLLTIGLTYFSWRWSMLAVAALCLAMAVVIWTMLKPTEEERLERTASSRLNLWAHG